jgi:hypothetical protein
VFRTAVVSIVLAVTVGQTAPLACRALCGPHLASVTGCHHESTNSPAAVSAGDSCPSPVLTEQAAIREVVRRGPAAPDMQHAVPVPQCGGGHVSIDRGFGAGLPAREVRPPILTIRI